jgi:opacity protein-like surface antigen
MVFRIITICFLTLLLAMPAKAQSAFYFDGINLRWSIGALVAHPYTYPSPEDENFKLHSRVGLITSAGLGFWFSLPEGLRWRSEVEGGYSRHSLVGFPPLSSQQGTEQGRGTITNGLVHWNNYIHFTDRFAYHQPYAGFGVGAQRTDIDYYHGQNFEEPQKWFFGLNVELGYTYRLTQQLGVGVGYRYSHLFSNPHKLKQSQVLFSISYGF